MEKKTELLREFMSATGTDEINAEAVLKSCQWNVELAKQKLENHDVGVTSPGVDEKENGDHDVVSLSTKPQEQRRVLFARGFSTVDPVMVSKLHKDITNMKGKEGDEERYGCFRNVALTRFSFTLPNFTNYEEKFVEFLMKELIENSTLKALEDSGHLNWLVKNNCFQRLLPLATSGDGNCLLHAASLGIWGVHDRLLNLRQAVHCTLTSTLAEKTIKRRWHWYQWIKNRNDELVFSEEEWEKEWQLMLSLASPRPRSLLTKSSLVTVPEVVNDDKDDKGNITQVSKPRKFSSCSEPHYESLEEVHVFALAHALQRPIIVISDTVMKGLDGIAICPIPFGGVYLPVECDPEECCRIPLVLAYSSSHFSPVVAMEHQTNQESSTVQVVPLVDKQLNPLPLPFAADPGNDWDCLKHENDNVIKEKSLASDERMLLLKKYLDVVFVNANLQPVQQYRETPQEETSNSGSGDVSDPKADKLVVQHAVAVVELPCGKQPSYYKQLIAEYIEKAKQRFDFEHEMQEFLPPRVEMSSSKCASDGCDLYGTVANNYLCTKCFQVQLDSVKDFKPDDKAEKWELVEQPPPDNPPSYSEVVGTDRVYFPPSFREAQRSSEKISETSLAIIPQQCQADECTFFGTAGKNGFCSKCYDKHRQ